MILMRKIEPNQKKNRVATLDTALFINKQGAIRIRLHHD